MARLHEGALLVMTFWCTAARGCALRCKFRSAAHCGTPRAEAASRNVAAHARRTWYSSARPAVSCKR
eukprot:10226760-Alexandrium_andersonii.AAC.1